MGHDKDVMAVASDEGDVLKDLHDASIAFTQLAEGGPPDVDSIAHGIKALIPQCVIGSNCSITEEVGRGFDTDAYPYLGQDVAANVVESASSTLSAMAQSYTIVPKPVIPAGSRSVALSVSVLCGSVAKLVEFSDSRLLIDIERETLAVI
ncbi:hypothetical protein EON76_01810 [bacterium]|nr:MAG: hypothetical protein EON76_01810 [bacterium]